MTLNKRILRNVRHNRVFYIGSILLCAFTVALIIAAVSTGKTMKIAIDNFYNDYQVEDAQFTLRQHISDDEIEKLESKYELEIEIMRYEEQDINDSVVRIFAETKKLNHAQITQGHRAMKDNEIMLSEDYAIANGYKIQDTMNIEGRKFQIIGFFTRPDYTFMLKALNNSYVNNEKFGIAIVNEKSFNKPNTQKMYYSVCYNMDNSVEFRQELNNKYQIINYIAAEQNYRINFAATQGDAIVGMAKSLSPIFFILIMCIIGITLSRIVKGDRKIIGVLLAQGYKRKELIWYYAKYTLPIAVIGSISGIGAGLLLLEPFFNYYKSDFNFPTYNLNISFVSLIIVIILPLILFFLVAALVVARMLKSAVVVLLHGNNSERAKMGSKMFARSNFSNSFKYSVRNIMRNKGRSLVLILGIIMSSILILIGLIMRSSCLNIINNELAATNQYNYIYYYLFEQNSEVPNGTEPFYKMGFESKNDDNTLQLIGIDFDSKIFPIVTEQGEKLDEKKVYASKTLAEVMNIKPGDIISFVHPITLKEYTTKIDGITTIKTQKAIYMQLNRANNFMEVEEGTFNGLYSMNKLDIKPELLSLTLKESDEIENFEKLLDPIMTIVHILIIFGMILGIIAIAIITNMVVGENVSNVSMLKVLGYKLGEISKMLISMNKWFVIIGYLLAIPLSISICKLAFLTDIETLKMYIDTVFTTADFFSGLILVLSTYFITLFFAKRKLNKVDLISSLKDNREN